MKGLERKYVKLKNKLIKKEDYSTGNIEVSDVGCGYTMHAAILVRSEEVVTFKCLKLNY